MRPPSHRGPDGGFAAGPSGWGWNLTLTGTLPRPPWIRQRGEAGRPDAWDRRLGGHGDPEGVLARLERAARDLSVPKRTLTRLPADSGRARNREGRLVRGGLR